MPFGFSNAPSIQRVRSAYVENFRQVVEYERRFGIGGLARGEYQLLTRRIFDRHRGTMLDVAKGVFEFKEELEAVFGDGIELAELRKELKAIREIEDSLDEFFTDRLTLRLCISHVASLDGSAADPLFTKDNVLGVVTMNTNPIAVLTRAFESTRFMCVRDFEMAPELLVNGMPHEEYFSEKGSLQHNFPYVHTHLFYMLLELLKNAARATIERSLYGSEYDPQSFLTNGPWCSKVPPLRPVHVVLPEDVNTWNQERSVKLADSGTGMNRHVLSKAFSYFYSSMEIKPQVAQDVSDFDRNAPLAGFGFGLPISRVMARYFSGDIDLNSIPGKGTDVHIYL
jgi:pyruvate dehydrogenase kinase 2/3/4